MTERPADHPTSDVDPLTVFDPAKREADLRAAGVRRTL